jgi:hypothetical protein
MNLSLTASLSANQYSGPPPVISVCIDTSEKIDLYTNYVRWFFLNLKFDKNQFSTDVSLQLANEKCQNILFKLNFRKKIISLNHF